MSIRLGGYPVAVVAGIVISVLAPVTSRVSAQEHASDTLLTVGHYLDLVQVADPQISPDGARIVYTRRWVNKLEDRWVADLWIMNADGSQDRFLARGGNAMWSPDSKRIAYIADGEAKGAQVFVRFVDLGGEGTQITRAEEVPGDLHWSPDGQWLGFSMFVAKSLDWKIDLPSAPEGAKWTKAPKYFERLHYRADRRGFLKSGYTHLFVVRADGGVVRDVTPGDWNVGSRFDQLPGPVAWNWMPDGRTIVTSGLNAADADHRYRDSDLFLIDVSTATARKLTPDRGGWDTPVPSPDGKWIAFTGYPASTKSYQAAALYVMRSDGSDARSLTATLDRDPSDLHWATDGGGVYFGALDQGTSAVFFAPLTGSIRRLSSGPQLLSLASTARTGIAAGTRTQSQRPAEIVTYDLRKFAGVTQLTHVNDELFARIRLGAVEEIKYASTGGAQIQGWVIKPPGFSPGHKYPLILQIHGGPHGMFNSGFTFGMQNLAANGFVVLYVNPRGSTGYGTAFGNAIERAYPSVDYDDLMAGVDTMLARGYVDSHRLFVEGCSGGGVLTSWVIGHTTRFTAAAVLCPVIDWISMAGETDIPLFTYNFFDAPFWEKPEQWLKQSPLMYVGNVTTPTLLMTGELDMRTPMPQTEEYYAALKMRGVPTALLRFEDEYHGTGSKPSNFMRTQLYMMSWFKRWADSSGAKAAASP